MMDLRRLMAEDLPRLRRFWMEHWGGETMVAHGEVFHPEGLEGFVAGDWAGLVTYYVKGDECEIMSLDSSRSIVGWSWTWLANQMVARQT